MPKRTTITAALLLSILFSGQAVAAVAELILTAPPRETKEQAEALYGPLAESLTEVLGKEVIFQFPGNWLHYASNMRKDAYDLVFDGPHLTAWRMEHLGHEVLVRLPSPLRYHLVRRAVDEDIAELDDLIGQPVCGVGPPNLGTMVALSLYPNPARQPVIHSIRGGFANAVAGLTDGKCRAAILRNQYYDKMLSDADRDALHILSTSRPLPGQTISAGKRVVTQDKERIAAALLGNGPVAEAASRIAKRFDGNSEAFMAANPNEYRGLNLLLEDVVFGW